MRLLKTILLTLLQATIQPKRRLDRLTRLAPHRPYVPLVRSYLPTHWQDTGYSWIGRPRSPPHVPMSPSSMTSDERADCVRPNHFEELSDIDAYDYMVFAESREPRPEVDTSDDDSSAADD